MPEVTQETLDKVAAWQRAQEAAPKPSVWQQALSWEKANSRKIAMAVGGIVVKSTYAKGAIAVLLALLGLQGCASSIPTANQAKLDCFAAAIGPVVGDVFEPHELVKEMVAGKASLPALLKNLHVSDEQATALLQRLSACEPPQLPVQTVVQ